jgi:hypothetical protein
MMVVVVMAKLLFQTIAGSFGLDKAQNTEPLSHYRDFCELAMIDGAG